MAMGYAGWAKIGPTASAEAILLTSCNINPELNPIISQSAVGLGWKNAADQTHYANGVMDYRGGIGFDMPISLWALINEWALTKRIYAKDFEHSPDGTRKYVYGTAAETEENLEGAWCDSLSFSTSTDSTLQSSINILALSRTESAGSGYEDNVNGILGSACATFPDDPLNPAQFNMAPIPFWKTLAQVLIGGNEPVANISTISWGIDLSNNAQIIKACNGGTGTYGTATAVVMGAMSVTGNVELYNHSGVWDPVLTNPIIAKTASFKVTVENGGTDKYIELPAVRLENDDYSLNLSGPVTRRFTLKGMGGQCSTSVLPPMSMT